MAPTDRELLRKARAFTAKKKLGQHFLLDAGVLQRIAAALQIEAGDHIIEIGPGIGFLTELLIEQGATVEAVELDRESVSYLNGLALPGLVVKHADFLGYDIGADRGARIKIAGNIPYQITGLILGHIFGEIGKPQPWLPNLERIVLMVQKEVALRMTAQPGSKHFAQLSLFIKYFGDAQIVEVVANDSFFPIPEVDSAVVMIKPRTFDYPCRNHSFLRRLIVAGFAKRRKMLRNALQAVRLPKGSIDDAFKKLDIDPQIRAEELSLEQFAMLSNTLDSMQHETANS